jgi:transposase
MGTRKMLERQTEFSVLDEAYRGERDGRRRSHLQVIRLLLQGNPVSEAARVTGFSERWINILIDRWNARGLAGLGDRRRSNKGAQPLLDDAGLAALDAALSEDPADRGVWSGRQVAVWMSDYLGRPVSPKRGFDYLHRLNYSRQQPRPRHAKAASPEEQDRFKKKSRRQWRRRVEKPAAARSKSGLSTSIASG